MSTHRRQTVLRTAAVSALVGGALLVPAAGALAAAPTASHAPKPTASAEVYDVTLGDGAKADVRSRGGSYVATLSVKGEQIATLSATHPTVTEGGVRYELYPSNGHIGITHLKGEATKGTGGKDTKGGDKTAGAPKGGVRAGAEGVPSTGDPAFLVAGGGMAAAGAAGLGFAMLRRGRTDS
ncbi:hypothetical protein GKQ77_21730 [Streptomyces sp. BG9H]|uniref:Gram-positive cocci surface proteins LPxTG domain-containing protein n=1 Tax=Streptomyces anatolicus TaxID=2675858 RepID=A0ABS6YUC1_9ACTN|nr:hypothetical protein [Streptomyces anatolicus]MBW5424152.1 hypothetical protein [Streptomyces anatolicus]